jgi:hypothetical protein
MFWFKNSLTLRSIIVKHMNYIERSSITCVQIRQYITWNSQYHTPLQDTLTITSSIQQRRQYLANDARFFSPNDDEAFGVLAGQSATLKSRPTHLFWIYGVF